MRGIPNGLLPYFLASCISVFVLYTLPCWQVLPTTKNNPDIYWHIVDPNKGQISFFNRTPTGALYHNIKAVKLAVEKQHRAELRFAMNGGMYLKDGSPQGLYIEDYTVKVPLDTLTNGYGNFYMQPNGVFYLDSTNAATVAPSAQFKLSNQIRYATQSGPMLLIDGEFHPKFRKGSSNVHIRNGVGLLPDGKILFAISKTRINFYDFASFFKSKGCKYALYLDGFVSRGYIPEQNLEQLDGHFGIVIAEIDSL